ncbi:MAG TPA: T9SS type A sorting domain-containing protein, partial [Phnomibacter sp.]|nr:T9SS type A sorting domain-containing protein [Phnomibacter sp.]
RSTIAAKSLSPASYSADDIPAFFGDVYVHYRIKAVDKDGSFSWSKVIRINIEEPNEQMTIFENPVGTTLRFRIAENVIHEPAQAIIVDMQGRVYSQTTLSAGGYQAMSTSALSSGIYLLQVKTGNETITRKFLKQ